MAQGIPIRSELLPSVTALDMNGHSRSASAEHLALAVLFFASGWAAILYELIWLRTLFAVIGINIEAVTLIVTEFMLGLGVGSLIGGRLSRAFRSTSLRWFAVLELTVAAFGAVSLPVLRAVGGWTLDLPPALAAVSTFLLLALPTIAMGATLPLLVNYWVGRSGNVGWSVGSFYFVNTLGSAAAAFASVVVLMRVLGQQGVVWMAVTCNVTVALGAVLLSRMAGGSR
jgi:spermidine synthase